jgi:hypothetical protein
MQSSMLRHITEDFGNGGTIDGDLTISGDLTVSGGGSLSFDEIIEGTQVIDVTSTEAFLVRKDSDGGDVFIVDTTNGDVTVQNSGNAFLNITSTGGGARMKFTGQANETTNGILFYENADVRGQINYNHAVQKMEFKTGDSNATALTLNSSQDALFSGSVRILDTSAPHVRLNPDASDATDNDRAFIGYATANDNFITGTVDNDLAIRSSSTGNIVFGRGTTESARLDSSGNVVIGQTTAQQKLEVHGGGIRIAGNITTPSSGVTGALIDYFGSDTRFWSRGADASTVGSFKFIGLENDGGNQSTQLEIDSSGNATFGGSITAQDALFVTASDNVAKFESSDAIARIVIEDNASENNGNWIAVQNDVMSFATNGSNTALTLGSDQQATFGNHINLNDNVKALFGNANDLQIYHNGTHSYINEGGTGNLIIAQGTDTAIFSPTSVTINRDTTFSGDVTISNTDALLNLTSGASNDSVIRFNQDTTQRATIGYDDTNDLLKINNNSNFGGTNHLVVDSSGNVAIGTTSVLDGGGSKTVLTISDDTQSVLVFEDTGYESSGDGLGMFAYNDGTLTYRTSSRSGTDWAGSTNRLVIDANSRISLSNNDSGTSNTLFGYQAGNAISDSGSTGNVLIGHRAGRIADNSSFDNNVAIGFEAMQGVGGRNLQGAVAVGSGAMRQCDSGAPDGTVAIGFQSLYSLTTGEKNVSIGFESMLSQTDGANNTVIGYNALKNADSGESDNVVIGKEAGINIDHANADANVIIGSNAGFGGAGAMSGAVVIGANAMNSTGANTMTGAVAIGYNALTSLTSGVSNTAVGYQALESNTTARYNTSVGAFALQYNANGEHNVAIGVSAGRYDASDNDVTSPDQCIAIGSGSGFSTATPGNQIAIGHNVKGLKDNSITLGNANITDVYMASDSEAIVHCGGVRFPDNQVTSSDANQLDDYEEGAWTPVIKDTSDNAMTMDGNTSGRYVKIGSQVSITARVQSTSLGSASGNIKITGLPFTSTNAQAYKSGARGVVALNLNITAGHTVAVYLGMNTTELRLYVSDATTGDTEMQASEWSHDGHLIFNFSYFV